MNGQLMTRRMRYAIAGGLLALGAPAGLLLTRMLRQHFPLRSAVREIEQDLATYVYSATSTAVAFTIFGAIVGRYADQLAELATTDPLTGLVNARGFHDRLRHELGRADRYQEPLSLLILDLDGLKRVNDHLGHEAGDAALRSIAGAIRSELREIDLGARLGGDEFGVLAPRTTEESALVLAERLRSCVVASSHDVLGHSTTISIGIASLIPARNERSTAAALIAAADAALYRAKRAGGNRAVGAAPFACEARRLTGSTLTWRSR
jgi:diguanylate cyclase (GGDEF)-like protein